MTVFDHTTTAPRHRIYAGVIPKALREIGVWHAAWQEHQRVQKLDADALRDMGISEAERRSITIAQIAARMRG